MNNARTQLGLDLPVVGTNIELLPVEGEHLPAFKPFFKDEAALYYYLPGTLKTYDERALSELFKDWNNGDTDVLLTISKDKKPIGLISIDQIDRDNKNAELGIALTDPESRGKGLAKAAIRLLTEHLLKQNRLHRLYARVAVGNHRSRHLFEVSGFRYEGTLRDAMLRPDGYLDMDVLGKVGD
ncbi:MAG TPA: GNAT family N-acetyltransferase [Clostridiaceae bacterium]|jgi:RimJ/RimL family protein N-acetyltransferase|nr:GNAT family N-acetyltransferase [Clostridiaceae bacterium]